MSELYHAALQNFSPSLTGYEMRLISALLMKIPDKTAVTGQAPAVKKYIEELLELDVKFIIFAHHQALISACISVLNQLRFSSTGFQNPLSLLASVVFSQSITLHHSLRSMHYPSAYLSVCYTFYWSRHVLMDTSFPTLF